MPNDLDRRMKLTMAAESASAARNRLYAAQAKKNDRNQLAKLLTAMSTGEQISARRALIYLRGKIDRPDHHLNGFGSKRKGTQLRSIRPAARRPHPPVIDRPKPRSNNSKRSAATTLRCWEMPTSIRPITNSMSVRSAVLSHWMPFPKNARCAVRCRNASNKLPYRPLLPLCWHRRDKVLI